MLTIDRRAFIRLSAAGLALSVLQPALAAEPGAQLFSFVSQAESIVAALTKEDAGSLRDAAAVAKALRERETITVWRYAVRKATDGELEQAPHSKISIQAQGVLRIEPYRTPLRVMPLD